MIIECNHPLIQTKLSIMRDKESSSKLFRESLSEIGSLMTYKVFEDLKVYKAEEITTPTNAKVNRIRLEKEIILVPILRAGLGMVDGVHNMLPSSRIGHIGMYRDEETLEPKEYYFKLPQVDNPLILLIDPMLATGGSAVAAITAMKKRGYTDIRFMCLVAAPEGIKEVEKHFPDLKIYCASIDERLNDDGYIIPGLGDAGDRIFGTK